VWMKYFSIPVLFLLFFVQAQPELYQFSHGGLNREYYLYVPDSLVVDAPLLFVFHGYSGSASGIMNYSGLNQIADDNGFVVCYPQGLIDDWDYSFWNVGYDWHVDETVDDVGFTTFLAQYLQTEYNLSAQNTFSTGMSNGGDMSYLLACQASDVFRAIAPVAGCMMTWLYNSCAPVNPVPVFEIHGTDDDVTWWDGADEINNDGYGPWESVDTTFNFWTQLNSCTEFIIDTLPDIDMSDGSYVVSHKNTNGLNNNEVWLYEVVNGGHDWPGVWGNMDISTSEEIWNFFENFINNNLGIADNNHRQDPNTFLLKQNYPNPFNPETTLHYYLLEQSFVNISIYDMFGREIKNLIKETQKTGQWSIKWNATNNDGKFVSGGVYFYKIQAESYLKTGKMTLLK
jgi:polyhydroxybutyrate depolymerase